MTYKPREYTLSSYQTREAMEFRALYSRYVIWLEEQGCLIQPPTSEWEVLRYRWWTPEATTPPSVSVTYDDVETPKMKEKDRTKSESHIVYRRGDGSFSFRGDALMHFNRFRSGTRLTRPWYVNEGESIQPPKKTVSWTQKTREVLLERDGHACFFCGKTMIGHDHTGRETAPDPRTGEARNDITIEHMLSQKMGREEGVDVNHIDNLVLAHAKCNRDIGHQPVNEKLIYRDIMHDQTSKVEHWEHEDIQPPRRPRR